MKGNINLEPDTASQLGCEPGTQCELTVLITVPADFDPKNGLHAEVDEARYEGAEPEAEAEPTGDDEAYAPPAPSAAPAGLPGKKAPAYA